MSGNERIKIIFTDDGIDKAVTGFFISEDDFLVKIKRDDTGKIESFGKRAIIRIKVLDGGGLV